MKKMLSAIGIVALAIVAGCGANKSGSQAASSKTSFDPAALSAIALDGKPVSVAGITFAPPSTWTDLGPSGMKSGNYAFGPIEGEKDSATMAVYFFGQNSGGGVMDNINRWISQMKTTDAKDPNDSTAQREIKVEGMTAHIVELSGTYASGGMMGAPTVEKENYRMTAVVLEAPGGNVFFKLTGPVITAQKMSEAFAALLLHVKKSEGTM